MISGRWAGCGQSAWAARLTCHLVYLRLTTRGNDLARRLGLRRRARRVVAMFQSLASSSSGGKAALLGGVSGDPECGNERDPVWVSAAVDLDVGHHQPDGVVAAQHGPQFLVDQLR